MKIVKRTICLMTVCAAVVAFQMPAFAAGTDALVVTESGNVGIGTNSPLYSLDVPTGGWFRFGSGGDDGRIFAQYANYAPTLFLSDGNDPPKIQFQQTGEGDESNPQYSAWFGMAKKRSNDLAIMGGRLGIGTTKPGSRLHVVGGALKITGAGTNTGVRIAGSWIGDHYDGVLRIRSGGGSVSFDGEDIVGIGTTEPESKLHVVGGSLKITGAGTETGVQIAGSWIGDHYDGVLHIRSGGGTVSFDGEDNVGIGINVAPSEKLHVGGYVCSLGSRCASDARWKENISPIENTLDRITQLRGVTYEWTDKSKGEGRHLGVIAQEVEEVFPEVVRTDSQGYRSVEYSKLVAPLIEAVKTLKAENDALKERISRLEALSAE
jgi:hypothetical protein